MPRRRPPTATLATLLLGLSLVPAREAGAATGWLARSADPQLGAIELQARIDQQRRELGLPPVTLQQSLAPGLWRLQAEADSAASLAGPGAPFVHIEADRRVRARLVPNDPQYFEQWNLFETYGVNAAAAWDIERGDPGVVIAVLDTGHLAHRDLDPARVLPGYDLISDPWAANDGDGPDADPSDPGDAVAAGECAPGSPAEDSSWHGLGITGLILASTDNGRDLAGLDHRARLLPVRVLGRCGGLLSDIITGLRWAAGLPVSGLPTNPHPADVLNLSLSGEGPCSSNLQLTLNEIAGLGAVVVAAAGNRGSDASEEFPANCDQLIAVTASTRRGSLASYASRGSVVDLVAPGGDRFDALLTLGNRGSSHPGADELRTRFGTSLAAAHVSAAAALLEAALGPLGLTATLDRLQRTATPLADDSCRSGLCGAGLLDLHAALAGPGPAPGTAPGDTATPDSDGQGGGGGLSPWWLATLLLVRRLATPQPPRPHRRQP